MFGSKYGYALLSGFAGASLLSFFSLFQKSMLGIPLSAAPSAFVVPLIYGGLSGLIIGHQFFRIRKSKDELEVIMDLSLDWEYLQNEAGDIIYSSPSCMTLSGYEPEEFMKNPELLDSIVHPEDSSLWSEHREYALSERCACASGASIATGTPGFTDDPGSTGASDSTNTLEFRIICKNGTVKWIHHYCRIAEAEDNSLLIRVSNRDITARMKIQADLKVLKGFIPICSCCKKIRDDKGFWNQLESFIRDNSEAEFTHGICPDCSERILQDNCFAIKPENEYP
ncbi:MAG: hypothetical protein CVV64_16560 [Candidatus Wallbacteria bacterium HGW-Wallbacteria-1]|jgi:hypothetical protein|uniref:PAS domain-containing protein n=1 Tax=Candidatus Wallbacteria bacterium HGW-Wallbacteria-1 TaxID=2013854 RepID=A0A2N1PKS6_9BACT|nr:MAG: hypothetical protein CVV64_16560 [Candidatus Wallbacteria bacterium HGW-Wallbacteria-1]